MTAEKMRPIGEVIEAVIKLTPEEFKKEKPSYLHTLRRIQASAAYCPPETHQVWWSSLVQCLYVQIGTPDCEWKQIVALVMMDKLDYRGFDKAQADGILKSMKLNH